MGHTKFTVTVTLTVYVGFHLFSFALGQCSNATYPLELTASSFPQYITSPEYPGTYPANSSCAWRITAPTNSYIILNVENISLSATVNPVCTGHDTLTVYNGYNETDIQLIHVCPNNADDVNSVFPTSNVIYITFTSEDTPHAGYFNILYFANDSDSQFECNGTVTRYASSVTGTLMSPLATESLVGCNLTVFSHLDNNFTFTIHYMNLLGGDCSTSSLTIYDGNTMNDSLLHQSCTSDTVYTFSNISTSGPTAFIVLHIPQGNFGILLTYVTNPYTNSSCDNTPVPLTAVFNTENYIESEGFGSEYSNRLRCRWLITTQNTSMAVEVFFHNSSFGLEYSYYCGYDYVILYDGSRASYSNQINRFCGSSVPEGTYRTTGNQMLVYFRTDYAIVKQGFRLVYKAVENNCDSLFTEYDATYNINTNTTDYRNISSPNYNIGDYPRNSDVYWLFTNVNYNTHRIVVDIQEIRIEKATNCIYDRVVAYNGSCITDEVVDVACGRRRVRFDLYNEKHLVRFVSDGILEYDGFYAFYYVIPLPTPIPPTTTTVQNGPALEVVVDTVNELLTNYSTENLPTRVLNDSINATIDFYLVGINGLDETDQILTTTGQFVVTWTDGNIAWDPTKRSDMQLVLMPQNDIWRPDIVLMNGVNKITAMGSSFMFIVVDYNGSCIWRPYQVLQSTCQVDMTKYPYDSQTCYLMFGTWSSSDSEVRTDFAGDGMKIHEKFTENSVWRLAEHGASEETINSQRVIKFTLVLDRNPVYVTVYITIPLVMLAYINVFTFTIPAGSGEKSGFAITVFLSFVVVLIVVSESIPRNSENISLFAAYILAMTMMSGLATCITVVQIRVITLESFRYAVPPVLKRFVTFTNKIAYRISCFPKLRKDEKETDNKSPTHSSQVKSGENKSSARPNSVTVTDDRGRNAETFSRYRNRRYSWLDDDSLDIDQSYSSSDKAILMNHTDVSKDLDFKRELTVGSILLVKENTNVDIDQNQDNISEEGSAMFSDEDEVIEEIMKAITDESPGDLKEKHRLVDTNGSVKSPNQPRPNADQEMENISEVQNIEELQKSAKSMKRVTFKDEPGSNKEQFTRPHNNLSNATITENETKGVNTGNPGILRSHTDSEIRLYADSFVGKQIIDGSNTVAGILMDSEINDQTFTKSNITSKQASDPVVHFRSSSRETPTARTESHDLQVDFSQSDRPGSCVSNTRPFSVTSRTARPGSRMSRSGSRLSYIGIASPNAHASRNPFGSDGLTFPLSENQPFSVYGRESRMSEYYPQLYAEKDPYDWEVTRYNQSEKYDHQEDEEKGVEENDEDRPDETEEVSNITWDDVVNFSDLYLFVGYLTVTTIITVAFFVVISN